MLSPNSILNIIGLVFYNQTVLTVFWALVLFLGVVKGIQRPRILLGLYFSLSIINPQNELPLFSSLPLMKLVIMLALGSIMINTGQVRFRFPVLFCVFSFFIATSWISYFGAVDMSLSSKRFWEFNKIFFVCFLTLSVLGSRDDYDFLQRVILFSFYFLILQTLTETQTKGRWYAVQGPGGWIGDSNDWGLAIAMFMPFVFMEVRQAKTLATRVFHGLAGVSTLLALTFTSSRGGFLASVAASLALLVTESKRFMALLVGVTILLVVSYYIPDSYMNQIRSIFQSADYVEQAWEGDMSEDKYTGAERVWNWKLAKRMMDDYPFSGVGWGNYVSMKGDYDSSPEPTVAHSTWFQVGAEAGYTGLTAFIVLILFTLESLRKSWKTGKQMNDPWLRANARCLAAGLAAFCVGGTFVSREYSDLLFCYMTMAMALSWFRYDKVQAATAPGDSGKDDFAPESSAWGNRHGMG